MMRIKRIYDGPSATDGYRILVDRLWPRGISKERAAIDLWLKEVAPSTDLRTWFGHDPSKFTEFQKRYQEELANNPAAPELISLMGRHPSVTLLYAAKDPAVNHAVVLQAFLRSRL